MQAPSCLSLCMRNNCHPIFGGPLDNFYFPTKLNFNLYLIARKESSELHTYIYNVPNLRVRSL